VGIGLGEVRACKESSGRVNIYIMPKLKLNNLKTLDTSSKHSAFTIVELLVVIVVIGILTAITVVSYTGVTSKAVAASLRSDLTSAKTKLQMYQVDYGSFPTVMTKTDETLCPSAPTIDNKYCIKPSTGNSFTYYPSTTSTTNTAPDFNLWANKADLYVRITPNSPPTANLTKSCPYGFIVVPGSSTYGTSDFCVMKYEAKADDNGDGIGDTNRTTGYNTWPANTYPISATRKLVSTPQGYPVANISQTTAISASQNYTANCTSCHLITEAEWMTIAQNVLSNPVNWSTGTVGSGYIYSGHNDNNPASAQEADTNDTNGYASTNNTTGSNQKRTLTLTNGEVIWDLAGNVWEWTSGQTTGGQPGISGETAFAWKDWPAVNVTGTLAVNPFPSGTGLSGASAWNATNGIGRLYSYVGDATVRGFLRGGSWLSSSYAGVLTLFLNYVPAYSNYYFGFRVAW